VAPEHPLHRVTHLADGRAGAGRLDAQRQQVAVAWKDYRDDTTESGYDDLYYNFSADGGSTWSDRDLRVDHVVSGSKFADDLKVSLTHAMILTAWTDGRNGDADVFFHAHQLGAESPPVVATEER